MQCPNDATTLVMSERSGIEIDYCPECRGIWLDRGELDKLIERSAEQAPPQWQQPQPGQPQGQPPQGQPQWQQPQQGQPQWDGQRSSGASGGLGAAAERLLGEVQRRSQGRDGRYDDRRDPRYDGRYDERREPRYDDRRRKGGWLGDILG